MPAAVSLVATVVEARSTEIISQRLLSGPKHGRQSRGHPATTFIDQGESEILVLESRKFSLSWLTEGNGTDSSNWCGCSGVLFMHYC